MHDTISIYTQIALSEENLLTVKKNCSQKSAHRIFLKHRKTAHNEKPCRLGWINVMAKCLASSQSEHGWRAPLNGHSRSGWNVLGRTFLGSGSLLTTMFPRLSVMATSTRSES
jgi:hypothetical protein